jgi:hypothetical protein
MCIAMPSSGQRGVSPSGLVIDDGRQWFEPGAEVSANSAIRRGALATAFNETVAETVLRDVIEARPGSDDASQAHELLSRIYLRSGQYTRLMDNFDRWAASFPNRREVQDEKADVEQFRGLPDQRNGPLRVSTMRHDPGDWSLPVSINGKPATYLLDSGAWISVMTESEATRLGLEIRAGSGTLGEPSGSGVRVRTAVAKDIRLGAMRFQDVSFAILPNKEPGARSLRANAAFSECRSGSRSDRSSGQTDGRGSSAVGPEPLIERHGTSSSLETTCCSRRVFRGRARSACSIPAQTTPI